MQGTQQQCGEDCAFAYWAAIDDKPKQEAPCTELHEEGFTCVRKKGHDGQHHAHTLEGTLVKAW